tara:strand:+ start:1472 stop:2371 length:900 start_codon:yes stop_codon:yes gene_type:complete
MNYSTLFPELLKRLPPINDKDMCYHYQKKNNDNKQFKLYIPSGRKSILWFVNYNTNHYCVLLNYDQRTKSIDKCFFHYMAFKDELTSGCGTLITCIKVEREICLYKYLYYKGERYTKPLISQQCFDFKYMLENYISPLPKRDFVSLHVPYMSFQRNILLEATSLPYMIHSVISVSNYQMNLHEYCAHILVQAEDVKKGIYYLYVRNKQNDLVFYQSALVNDMKTNHICRKIFSKHFKTHINIEHSDDEEDEVVNEKKIMLQCMYLPCKKKWKPLCRSTKMMDSLSKIKFIENKKYDSIV